MNLQDLLDENGLQQDEWSETTPRFGEKGQLTVVGWSGRKTSPGKSHKLYILKCDICSEDGQLFGDGHFKSLKYSLTKGQIPCGCAKFVKWNKAQYEVLCARASSKSGNSFISFLNYNLKSARDSFIVQECPIHGEWDTGTMGNLLTKNTGCPKCKAVSTGKRCSETYIIDEDVITQGFKDKLPPTLRFKSWLGDYYGTRTPAEIECILHNRVIEISTKNIWQKLNSNQLVRICPDCVYENIKDTNSISEAQATALIKDLVDTDQTEFRGFVGNYEGVSKTKLKVYCKEHGETFTRVYGNLKNAAHPCPVCAAGNQIYAYMNIVLQEDLPITLKFGITGNPNRRLLHQNYSNSLKMEALSLFKFTSRQQSFAAEFECKKVLECRVIDRALMPDGWTETTYIYNLDKIKEIYKRHGGVEV